MFPFQKLKYFKFPLKVQKESTNRKEQSSFLHFPKEIRNFRKLCLNSQKLEWRRFTKAEKLSPTANEARLEERDPKEKSVLNKNRA